MAQGLRELRGKCPGVVAALSTMLLFIAGCGGSKPATPTPAFTPGAGTYTTVQNVTVSDTNQNAVLYCTNDGSAPTASSPQCANPTKVSQSQTLKAVAIAPGMDPSAVATAAFTIGASAPVPVVTAVTPAGGPSTGGTTVTITGTNFTGATAVNFGTSPATGVTVNSSTSITAVSPAGAGTVHVTVVTPAGTSSTSTADLFSYLAVPTITGLSPTSGMVGATVTITGTNFGSKQGASSVTFNGTTATSITSWSSTSIVAVVPVSATTGNVVVTVGGLASNGVPFTVTVPMPTITLLSPTSGAVGTSVAIVGTNFGTAQGSVAFGGVPAAITSWSDQAIVVTVPSGLSAGSVSVVVTTAGNQTANTTFTVSASSPTISGINPSSGVEGASVTATISGSGFGSTQGTVTFGSTPATITSWTDGSIVLTVPSSLAPGSVSVVVTTANNQTANTTFTVTPVTQTISGVVVSGPGLSGVPISASVQLYAAGTTGYGTGPQKVGDPVQTDSKTGAFSLTFECSSLPAGGDQSYLVATGGGQSQVVLMTALGSCSTISSSFSSVTINEATTIASAYALSGFASVDSSGGIDIGAPATGPSCNATAGWQSTGPSTCNYIGLKNAFATVQNLVDIPSGATCVITPAYSTSHSCLSTKGSTANYNISYAPQARVNSLANVLASCANPNTGTSANCASLFTNATVGTGTVPTDTLQATLSIAQHPGNNASTIAGLVPASPFQPTISSSDASALTDWTLAVVYEGAGLSNSLDSVHGAAVHFANGIAIDAVGNVWIPVENNAIGNSGATDTGLVAVFNNLGAPVSPSSTSTTVGGYQGVAVYNPQAIAIDQNGYAWIGNYPSSSPFAAGNPGSVSVMDVNGSPQYGTGANGAFTNKLLLTPNPFGIAVDGNNTVWVSSSASTFASTAGAGVGLPCSGGVFGGSILPLSGSGSTISVKGSAVDSYSDKSSCPYYLAIDQNGSLWTFDYGKTGGQNPFPQSLIVFNSDGSVAEGPYNYEPLNGLNLAISSNGDGWMFALPDGITGSMVDITPAEIASNNAAPANSLYLVDAINSYTWLGQLSPIALDGASQTWTVADNDDNTSTQDQYLFGVNSSDTGFLSPLSPDGDGTPWGFTGWDASSASPNPIDGNGITNFPMVDGSGNLWLVSSDPTQSRLSEFIGIAVPAHTPLVSGLVGNNTPGTRP